MKYLFLSGLYSMIIFMLACDKSTPDSVEISYSLSGSAQKGPFINGSEVNIYELDNQFIPTGRTFRTNTDELGHFELPGVMLISPYVQLTADGFYFNEVSGKLSNERLNLKAVSDLSDNAVVNINVLTNLEYDRVMYLVKSEGKTVSEAKTIAQQEIYKIFSFDTLLVKNPETLDIVNSGEADGALLAVSSILQANRTTSELSKLQADIIKDIKEDGILNDTIIQNELITNASTLNLNKIKTNLVSKYDELGVDLGNINNFDQFVNTFKENSGYHFYIPFDFPVTTTNGINVLSPEHTTFSANRNYAFAVNMPNAGKIMIKITMLSEHDNWFYQPMQSYGWKVSIYDFVEHSQTFESTINGELIDVPVLFGENDSAKLEYFFNDSEIPFITKTISWTRPDDPVNNGFSFPENADFGPNILMFADSTQLQNNVQYMVGLSNIDLFNIHFRLLFPSAVSVEVIGGAGDFSYKEGSGQLEFDLFGKNSSSYIFLKFTGEGTISMENNLYKELNFPMTQTFFLN